ncbi:MAG TPA: hypothetical protein VEF76_10465 [Patescibacteria group bacterium]|nr:hypothetical protein [Patescibacteria group bacterium]
MAFLSKSKLAFAVSVREAQTHEVVGIKHVKKAFFATGYAAKREQRIAILFS